MDASTLQPKEGSFLIVSYGTQLYDDRYFVVSQNGDSSHERE